MKHKLNKLIDNLSEYLAHRKGLIPLIGIGMILLNLIFQFIPLGWITETNLMLHLGLILALIGFLLSWAL
jgi:hypothetical protein